MPHLRERLIGRRRRELNSATVPDQDIWIMFMKRIFVATCYFAAFTFAAVVCVRMELGAGASRAAAPPSSAMVVQSGLAALHRLASAAKHKLTEQQCFRLARKAIVEGRAYSHAWFKAGHRIDYVSPQYDALAGKLYEMAVLAVHQRLAQGLPVSPAEHAKAIAYAAWWRFRGEPTSDYPKTITELKRAVKIDPHRAIYWVMLAQAIWYRSKRPVKPQWDLVVKYLRHAVQVDRKCADAYWFLGQTMVSGPHYGLPASAYDLKRAEHYDRLSYANRRHFNRFFHYYSGEWLRNEVWMTKEVLGIVPPNTMPPKRGTRKGDIHRH